mmetsp:Transcript_29895/g.84292  ORF Transcript_29895/g.84292 Transcript_29895/m.84292 type:complete len:242 (+) Transcript_29895:703-1428(+)
MRLLLQWLPPRQSLPNPLHVIVESLLELWDGQSIVLLCQIQPQDLHCIQAGSVVLCRLFWSDILKLGEGGDVRVGALAGALAVRGTNGPVNLLVDLVGIGPGEPPVLNGCGLHLLQGDDGHHTLLPDAVFLCEVRYVELLWVVLEGVMDLPLGLVAQKRIHVVVGDGPPSEVTLPHFQVFLPFLSILLSVPDEIPSGFSGCALWVVELQRVIYEGRITNWIIGLRFIHGGLSFASRGGEGP